MPVVESEICLRGDLATLRSIRCGSDVHAFTVSVDGEMRNTNHDSETDAVVVALGGEPHGCLQAYAAFAAAEMVVNAHMGISDAPTFVARRGSAMSDPAEVVCPHAGCGQVGMSFAHYASPQHTAARHGVSQANVKRLTQWIAKRRHNTRIVRGGRFAANQEYPTFFRNNENIQRAYLELNRTLLTASFVTVTTKVVGRHPSAISALRSGGVSIDWVKALVSDLPTRYRQPGRDAESEASELATSLIYARNANPTKVAEYVGAGIKAHFHTYAKQNVPARDVLTVWNNSGRSTSLAALLEQGHSVDSAIQLHCGERSV